MKAWAEVSSLLEQLLSASEELRSKIFADDDDIEEWTGLIDQREEIIKQISEFQNQGAIVTDEDKERYLQKVYEIDLQVFPLLEKKYDNLDRQSKNIQKSIMVGAKYGSYGNINPYGAYFDKRN
ncbi:hypothetical protein [Brevibacillus sp. MS2.2]|uniref:hypothetical protein n=1 Tax=Brevibacillus sp. MS2.2 TaxID=2738981 RepID=UPI00156B896B|nr:hypothetical protein [Brevibacillus sp. MS2.2]NRR23235.1 hypothetical protein [Brevibacillus sp. MS2.2]